MVYFRLPKCLEDNCYLESRVLQVETFKDKNAGSVFYCPKCEKYFLNENMVTKEELALYILKRKRNSCKLSDITKIELQPI